jgi:hypothetical protein
VAAKSWNSAVSLPAGCSGAVFGPDFRSRQNAAEPVNSTDMTSGAFLRDLIAAARKKIMMVAVFAALLAALALAMRGLRSAALAAVALCLALAIALFLYEIYSPQYGFRMPWLQTQLEPADGTGTARGVGGLRP